MSSILDESHVFLGCDAATADEALELIADKAVELGVADAADRSGLLEALRQREAAGTTGMAGGFAIPHCKSAVVREPAVIVLKFDGDVAWETVDKQGVRVALALLNPDGELATEHLSILSKIAALLMRQDFRDTLTASDDASRIVSAIREGLERH